MVAHKAIGIDMASGRNCLSQFINVGLRLPTKDVEETHVVLFILKHLLLVHATQYGVVNTGC